MVKLENEKSVNRELDCNKKNGEVLRLIRIAHDLTIRELAKKLKISYSYIGELEKGAKPISQKVIDRYSIVFNIAPDIMEYLFQENYDVNSSYQKMLLKLLSRIVS